MRLKQYTVNKNGVVEEEQEVGLRDNFWWVGALWKYGY